MVKSLACYVPDHGIHSTLTGTGVEPCILKEVILKHTQTESSTSKDALPSQGWIHLQALSYLG